ncbi:hypothetical protein [Mycobacteroides franklinii]|uniref:Uncharacterized protein n=1 Tax=Mycobacteroides franklinii TaxID=948102 RepID=A0A4R5P4X4_9MYCO|nr:hypothetical protein [Mycobacteroides franklinii]ORA58516.1 hypothetical protein BST24_21170 [Mycobacteroides franklinii]TDH17602.1 hypothetical protein EJ571_26895 [Mycobacteroides franklinii]TDZ46757.1 hypothetical protein CCUG64054_00584 [Mycobacteroides franklinii]TDZ53378.1 hypothetical protein CCUG63697_00243 [Mycobacteroides franklinii]TDZ60474.1 hypothetical protein CCUG63696_00586 [Mycobacteroides franklinii]
MTRLSAGAEWGLPPVIHGESWWAWTVVAVLVACLAISLVWVGWMTARKHEDALMYWLIMLSGVTILPYFVEPWLDVIGATTYMTNALPYVTIAERPLPIFVPLVWVGTAPTALIVYEMIKKGWAAWTLIVFALVFGIAECIGEMVNSHFGLMKYYSNNALVFGVPLPSLVQNGGFLVMIAWVLAVIRPHMRGYRWAAVLFVAPGAYLAYTIMCTLPNYFAIHLGLAPVPAWVLAALSTGLNLLAVCIVACSPTCQRYRDEVGAKVLGPVRIAARQPVTAA